MATRKTPDTFSYKGWLNSDLWYKRALGTLGYNSLGKLVILMMMIGIVIIFGLAGTFFTFTTTAFAQQTEESASLSDADHSLYEDAIKSFFAEGIISGYADGTFKPHKEINRAELLKILLKTNNIQEGGSNCYPDIQNQWFAPYVCKATELGIVQGYPDGLFRPEQTVTFSELSKMAVTVTGARPQEESGKPWYYPYVQHLEKAKAIPIGIKSFNKKMARGEVVEIAWRTHNGVSNKVSTTYGKISSFENFVPIQPEGIDDQFFNQLVTRVTAHINDPSNILEQHRKESFEFFGGTYIEHGSFDGVFTILDRTTKQFFFYPQIEASSAQELILSEDCHLFQDVNGVHLINNITNAVYTASETRSLEPLELGGFQGGHLFRGEKDVYFWENCSLKGLSVSDPATFDEYGEESDWFEDYYFKDKNYVYYQDAKNTLKKLEGADPATFEKLKYENGKEYYSFLRDKNYIYGSYHLYKKDENKTYYLFYHLEGADIESFLSWGSEYITRDRETLFGRDENGKLMAILNFDLSKVEQFDGYNFTTEKLEYGYGIFQDKNNIYSFDQVENKINIHAEIDKDSLTTTDVAGYNELVLKDKNRYYFLHPTHKDLISLDIKDQQQLEIMSLEPNYIFKVENQLYLLGSTPDFVPLILDAESFKVVFDNDYLPYVKTKDGVYYLDEESNIFVKDTRFDPETFWLRRSMGFSGYGGDKNGFYVLSHGLKLVKQGDAGQFTIKESQNSPSFFYYIYDDEDIWYYDTSRLRLVKIVGAKPAEFDFNQEASEIEQSGKYELITVLDYRAPLPTP